VSRGGVRAAATPGKDDRKMGRESPSSKEGRMRTLLFVAFATSTALMMQQSTAAAAAAWCRVNRDAGGNECIFYTFEQCAASTERLNGGNCIPNPFEPGVTTPASVTGARSTQHKVSRHKRHYYDASR
jgi:Protein of unknown function (DUF3551)